MDFKDILAILPKGYKEACWTEKAMTRKKGIQEEDELLKLCLYYSYGNSLIDTKNYAKMLNIEISDVGFMKRFGNCREWIKWILENITTGEVFNYTKPEPLKEYRVMAVDASDITQKGAVKQLWHLHYAVNLFNMSSEMFKITTEETGETLLNFELQPKDLVIADRAYGSIKGIEYCLNSGADFILRLRNKAFNLYNEAGEKAVLSDLLQNVTDSCQDFRLYYKANEELKPIRLCAVKKNKEDLEIENKRIKRIESKKQFKFSDETKLTRKYFFVVTSLGDEFTCEQIMNLYRLRWQVEMTFKHYKSILDLGSMPTRTLISSEVWLNCKMLIALLIEKMLSMVDFSPLFTQTESLEGNEGIVPFDFNVFF